MMRPLTLLTLLSLALGGSEDFGSYSVRLLTVTGASFKAKVDFSLPFILVSEDMLACNSDNACRFLDQNLQEGTVYGATFFYRLAVVDFGFKDERTGSTVKTSLKVRVSKTVLSVFGINPQAEYRENILPQRALRFRTNSKDVVVSKRAQTDVSLDWSEARQTHFIDAMLRYESDKKSVVAPANLCFHDEALEEASPFFLKGDENFKDDWRRFRRIADGIPDFACAVTFRDPQKKAFALPYSLELFDSYDLEPIKAFVTKKSPVCELFLGEFFLQRGSVEFVLENLDAGLKAYIRATETPYSKSVMYRWQFFIRLFFWLSMAVFVATIVWNHWRPLFRKGFVDLVTDLEVPITHL